ncbi:MAG: response regulator [Ignavibacteriaceae bacterium]|jgi:DNA-binding NtrC family response regulator|nr:response regulator [Ignavibacteriaceae bacterium]MCW9065296.1 response regulator [Ignavibacteriaceae bacterium]
MKIKILLVDDEKDFIESLAERLQLRDFDVSTALNGIDALKLMEENEFDVIVLDVKMPGKSGIDILKEIKNTNQLSQVIMLTGHATVESAIQGMKLGAYDYIMKPTVTEDLITLINKAYKIVEEQKERIRRAEIENIVKKRGW